MQKLYDRIEFYYYHIAGTPSAKNDLKKEEKKDVIS